VRAHPNSGGKTGTEHRKRREIQNDRTKQRERDADAAEDEKLPRCLDRVGGAGQATTMTAAIVAASTETQVTPRLFDSNASSMKPRKARNSAWYCLTRGASSRPSAISTAM